MSLCLLVEKKENSWNFPPNYPTSPNPFRLFPFQMQDQATPTPFLIPFTKPRGQKPRERLRVRLEEPSKSSKTKQAKPAPSIPSTPRFAEAVKPTVAPPPPPVLPLPVSASSTTPPVVPPPPSVVPSSTAPPQRKRKEARPLKKARQAVEPDVPAPRSVVYTKCWICDRAKPKGKRQFCSQCYLVHLRHDLKTYRKKEAKVQGCTKCRMMATTKTGLPGACIPGMKRLTPTHWTCVKCLAPFRTSSNLVSHILRCDSGAKPAKKRNLEFAKEAKVHDHTPMTATFFLLFLQAWRSGVVTRKGPEVVIKSLLEEVDVEVGPSSTPPPAFVEDLARTLAAWKDRLSKSKNVTLFFRGSYPWYVAPHHLERLDLLMKVLTKEEASPQ